MGPHSDADRRRAARQVQGRRRPAPNQDDRGADRVYRRLRREEPAREHGQEEEVIRETVAHPAVRDPEYSVAAGGRARYPAAPGDAAAALSHGADRIPAPP